MSDDLTEPTPTVEEPTEVVPEETPEEIDPALIELVKSLDAETLKNVKNLDEFYKRVNRMSMEVATERKKLEAQPATAPSPTAAEDDDEELTPEAQALLRKFLQKELAPVFSNIVEERHETEQKVWDEFTSSHRDVDADVIVEKFYELGFDKTSTTPAKYSAALEKAYKVAKAESLDVDAVVEQKLQERLAALKGKDEEVVEVKAKKSEIQAAPKTEAEILTDTSIPWHERFNWLNKA